MEDAEKNKHSLTSGEPSEIELLREELRHEHDMYLRALADFDNYRRRVERERSSAARSGKREVILPLLNVLDDFDRALTHLGDAPAALSDGLRAVHRKLLGLLDAQGVTPFKSLGEPFNPELHEALGSVDREDQEPGTVAEEMQRGYRWGADILRHARVRVAK
jgi:molecular chaperone GrpE